MIFAVSMTAGIDHDRLEGADETISLRMSQMLNLTIDRVKALLRDAEVTGAIEFQEANARAWIKRLH